MDFCFVQCADVANCDSYSTSDCSCIACNKFFGTPTNGECTVRPGKRHQCS